MITSHCQAQCEINTHHTVVDLWYPLRMRPDLLADAIASIERFRALREELPEDYRQQGWQQELHLARSRLEKMIDMRADGYAARVSIPTFFIVFGALIYANPILVERDIEMTWEVIASIGVAAGAHLLMLRRMKEALRARYQNYLRV